MSDAKAGCERCVFLWRQDTGYSNWTVTGESLECLKNVNPHMPIDDDVESERFEDALKYGESCNSKREGDPTWIDCDGENLDEIRKGNINGYDPEAVQLLLEKSDA